MLGRLATAGQDGRPHVVPVSLEYSADHDAIDGGHDFARRRSTETCRPTRGSRFVVDDVASTNPWRVRGIEIRGRADMFSSAAARRGVATTCAGPRGAPDRHLNGG
jgi:pyridoxamine 5'-phosphate oxidase family protein